MEVTLLRKIIKKVALNISNKNQYTEEQKEQIEYALKMLIFETLKVSGTVLIFSLLGFTVEVLVSVIVMVSVKPFLGGYHEDNQIKCFLATLVIVGISTYLGATEKIGFITMIILNISSLYCIWQQAPVINPKMPITREELIRRNKGLSVTITIIFISISIIFYKNTRISTTIVWMILFQALLLFNKPAKKRVD